MTNVDTPAARALRALQIYDELIPGHQYRYLIIEAETALGEELGLECTGEPDGWNEDGSVAFYSHDWETCPVHEWLVPDDCPTEMSEERSCIYRGIE